MFGKLKLLHFLRWLGYRQVLRSTDKLLKQQHKSDVCLELGILLRAELENRREFSRSQSRINNRWSLVFGCTVVILFMFSCSLLVGGGLSWSRWNMLVALIVFPYTISAAWFKVLSTEEHRTEWCITQQEYACIILMITNFVAGLVYFRTLPYTHNPPIVFSSFGSYALGYGWIRLILKHQEYVFGPEIDQLLVQWKWFLERVSDQILRTYGEEEGAELIIEYNLGQTPTLQLPS